MSSQIIHRRHRMSVVYLSIGISLIGSYVGIVLFEQYRLCLKKKQPKLLNKHSLMWLIATSIGGVAIWTMHFVGMSAITMTDPYGKTINISYRLDLTFLSLIIVVLLCYVGFYLSSLDGIYLIDTVDKVDEFIRCATRMSISELKAMRHKNQLLFMTLFKRMDSIVAGGTTMAAGACAMHYIGMEAMVIEHCKMTWNVGIVAASAIIAVVAATVAFWILFRLLALYPHYEILRIAGAVVAAVAVNGMHYTGMAALEVHYVSDPASTMAHDDTQSAVTVDQATASMGALIAAVIYLWLILVLVIADLRAWYYNFFQIVRRTDQLMHSVTADMKRIQDYNLPTTDYSPSWELLSKLPERYQQIREYDHYKSKSWPKIRIRRRPLRLLGGSSKGSSKAHSNGGGGSSVGHNNNRNSVVPLSSVVPNSPAGPLNV